MLSEDTGMFCQQPRFLLFNKQLDSQLFQSLGLHFLQLLVSLSSVNSQFLLPQVLNIAFMLQLPHAPLLLIHLLQAFVLSKFHHQLLLELLFNPPLLNSALLFHSLSKICCLLQLFPLSIFLSDFLPYTFLSQLFTFFKVKIIAQILLEFFLCPPL
jgi:hypothetical protein